MTRINLTPTQAKALSHRLAVDFLDDGGGVFSPYSDWPFTKEEAEESLYTILPAQVAARKLDPSKWNAATPHVLADCVGGSTWFIVHKYKPYGMAGARKTLLSLELLVYRLTGLTVTARTEMVQW